MFRLISKRRKPREKKQRTQKKVYEVTATGLDTERKEEEVPQSIVKKVQRWLLQFLAVVLTAFAVIIIGILVFTTRKTAKNIVLIKDNYSSETNQIVFARTSLESTRDGGVVLIPVEGLFTIVPQSLVLADQQFVDAQRRAALSLQLGVPVDEIWIVASLPTESISKAEFLSLWRSQLTLDSLRDIPQVSKAGLDWLGAWFELSAKKVILEERIQLEDSGSKLSALYSAPDGARNCSIAVVNTTTTAGLASSMSTFLESIGLVVVRVTDTDQRRETTEVIFSEDNQGCDLALNVVSASFADTISTSVDDEQANTYRAAMVIFLGEDIAQLLDETQLQ